MMYMTCLIVDGSPGWSGMALGATPLRALVRSSRSQPLLAATSTMPLASALLDGTGTKDRLPTYDDPVARPLPSPPVFGGPRLPPPFPLTTTRPPAPCATALGYQPVGSIPR